MHHKRGQRASVRDARGNIKALGKRVVTAAPGNGGTGRGRGKRVAVNLHEKVVPDEEA